MPGSGTEGTGTVDVLAHLLTSANDLLRSEGNDDTDHRCVTTDAMYEMINTSNPPRQPDSEPVHHRAAANMEPDTNADAH